jgi:hypothetical protein
MAEIVSLNQYRKTLRRLKAAAEASHKRVRHGRTKAEKHIDAGDRDLEAKSHDAKRLERMKSPPDTD